jgi:hypothetical protein
MTFLRTNVSSGSRVVATPVDGKNGDDLRISRVATKSKLKESAAQVNGADYREADFDHISQQTPHFLFPARF